MMTQFRFSLGVLTFGFFLVANPALFMGCSTATDDGYSYDEQDMLDVVELLNEQDELAVESGKFSGNFATFHVEQTSRKLAQRFAPSDLSTSRWITSAHACGTRTFVKEASACMDVSEMPLTGTIEFETDDGITEFVDVEGVMQVDSLHLSSAIFSFLVDDEWLTVTWSSESESPFSTVSAHP